MDTLPEEFLSAKNGRLQKTISFCGIPNSCTDLFLQIFPKRAAKPSAGNNSACSKASQAFSGTFPGTVLNLTWLCTKVSRNLRNLLRNFLCNLPCNPVEPNLALHQSPPRPSPEPSAEPCWTWPGSAPGLLRNLLRSPVEPDLALLQSFPGLPRNLLRNPLSLIALDLESSPEPLSEPCWTWLALHQSPPDLCWTWPGSAPKVPRQLEPSEPSPEPCWTWPGACTSARRSYSRLKISSRPNRSETLLCTVWIGHKVKRPSHRIISAGVFCFKRSIFFKCNCFRVKAGKISEKYLVTIFPDSEPFGSFV